MHETTRTEQLAVRLQREPPLLIDGGTGTEIERMGAAMHEKAWSARASLSDPDIVRRVHRAYLNAGAELIIANTYPANRHVMAGAGLIGEFEPANRRAVELAREARDQAQDAAQSAGKWSWVAGSMSTTTFTGGLDRSRIEEDGLPGAGYRAQAAILADAGADILILEMMRDVTETRLCLDTALDTGLPVWLGFSAERRADGALRFFGSEQSFADGVDMVLSSGRAPQAVGVMHSQLEATMDALDAVARSWGGPLFAYPHHGVFEMPHWRFEDTLEPEEFAAAAMEWVGRGVRAVGGCCGIRPRHIAALRAALDSGRAR
ncbi:MAG: homocysteine S-methyltransferase family protein [Oceanidesulfovibrio sp.]